MEVHPNTIQSEEEEEIGEEEEEENEEEEEGEVSSDCQNGDLVAVWEDSTLIQAYDKAIGLAKKKIMNGQKEPKEDVADELCSNKKIKSHNSPKNKWIVGSTCTARFSVDGHYYQAEIKAILPNDMCLVEYLGYGNEETLSLSSLQPPKGRQCRSLQLKQAKHWKKVSIQRRRDARLSRDLFRVHAREIMMGRSVAEKKRAEEQSKREVKREQEQGQYYQFPGINQSHTSRNDNSTAFLSTPTMPELPLMRPKNEREALSSMLMSWYMSGYHTGYYDALTRFKSEEKNKEN